MCYVTCDEWDSRWYVVVYNIWCYVVLLKCGDMCWCVICGAMWYVVLYDLSCHMICDDIWYEGLCEIEWCRVICIDVCYVLHCYVIMVMCDTCYVVCGDVWCVMVCGMWWVMALCVMWQCVICDVMWMLPVFVSGPSCSQGKESWHIVLHCFVFDCFLFYLMICSQSSSLQYNPIWYSVKSIRKIL